MSIQPPLETSSTTLTVRVPISLKDDLGRLAEHTRRSSSFLAGEAIAAYVARELEIVTAIEAGLADLRAGRVVPHDKVMAGVAARIARAKRAKSKK